MDGTLLDMFSRAVVRITFEDGPRVLHPDAPGEVGAAFPFSGPVHIVTAYNPGGEESDEAANAARHRELVVAAGALGLETLPTVGSGPDGSMPEPGLLLNGMSRPMAVSLGRTFGQAAIYEWSSGSLLILGVVDPGHRTLGWRLAEPLWVASS